MSGFSKGLARAVMATVMVAAVAGVVLAAGRSPAMAQERGPIVIRDTEIEAILKEWSTPLIRAAGMAPGSVNFILVQDPQVNAFVAGGANIFLYTGLIERTKTPGELIGVIAHELGHIRSGHLIRTRQALENASYESIIAMALGVGAAILTGDGGAATAVTMGGQGAAQSRFFTFSRIQESSADQAALEFMAESRINPEGLLTFMQQLESQELLPASQQSQYIRTHPLTRDRIDAISRRVQETAADTGGDPPHWREQHARFLAKLTGFMSPEKVAWAYDSRDDSMAARYARTIAAYRENRVERAVALADGLLAAEPQNPWFHELKGQMLLEFGQLGPAKQSLRRALEIVAADKGDAPLIRVLYAQALIEGSENGARAEDVREAVSQLDRALRAEPRSSQVHRLMAVAYGYQGREAEARLHLAEEAVLQRRFADARRLAEYASGQLQQGSRPWIRAQDILAYIDHAARDENEKERNNGRSGR